MLRMEPEQHPDWDRITELGGPIKVAAKLGWSKPGSIQRVQNWKYRGIPAAVKLAHPFLRKPAKPPVDHPEAALR